MNEIVQKHLISGISSVMLLSRRGMSLWKYEYRSLMCNSQSPTTIVTAFLTWTKRENEKTHYLPFIMYHSRAKISIPEHRNKTLTLWGSKDPYKIRSKKTQKNKRETGLTHKQNLWWVIKKSLCQMREYIIHVFPTAMLNDRSSGFDDWHSYPGMLMGYCQHQGLDQTLSLHVKVF